MSNSNKNYNKYGVQNNRNVTHQIILNIDNMLGGISSSQNESEEHISSHTRKDISKQYQNNKILEPYTKRKQSRKVPINISVNLYATSSEGKKFTNHFSRSQNCNFGVEVGIQNSNSRVYCFNISGCVYDLRGVEIYRWKPTIKEVPPSNSPVKNDFWVDKNKFRAMADGKYKMQLWINDIRVVKMFFTVSK